MEREAELPGSPAAAARIDNEGTTEGTGNTPGLALDVVWRPGLTVAREGPGGGFASFQGPGGPGAFGGRAQSHKPAPLSGKPRRAERLPRATPEDPQFHQDLRSRLANAGAAVH